MEKFSSTNLSKASKQLWEFLLPSLKYLEAADLAKVELAFLQMVESHKDQRRKSGEFYIIHPVHACQTLANMQMDSDTLSACLMHDVPEDTETSLKDLEENFNREIVFLISGITKLGKLKYKGEDRYAENLRKMFVAMSRDLRVIFIKLADRLHNLQTLGHLPAHKAHRIALESLEIYAPIAHRLGINYFKGEIEDAAFPYVYPDEYKQFKSISEVEINKRRKQVEKIIKRVHKILTEESIENFRVKGRAKRYYSLYQKLNSQNIKINQVYDLVAARIITSSVDECYHVLSLIHKHFTPIDKRLKDYIQKPKQNGYQSIHTSVKDNQSGVVFEVQIRTDQMDEQAEFGVASHWSYKNKNKSSFADPNNLKWISELVSLSRQEISSEDYLKHVRLDLFQDRIFVMTPKGDVIDLPAGATPIDFAYRIHQQIGNKAVRAFVGGQPIKLTDELKNGDQVEIQTDKNQSPKPDWLRVVKTHQATSQIRNNLRKQGIKLI